MDTGDLLRRLKQIFEVLNLVITCFFLSSLAYLVYTLVSSILRVKGRVQDALQSIDRDYSALGKNLAKGLGDNLGDGISTSSGRASLLELKHMFKKQAQLIQRRRESRRIPTVLPTIRIVNQVDISSMSRGFLYKISSDDMKIISIQPCLYEGGSQIKVFLCRNPIPTRVETRGFSLMDYNFLLSSPMDQFPFDREVERRFIQDLGVSNLEQFLEYSMDMMFKILPLIELDQYVLVDLRMEVKGMGISGLTSKRVG